MNRVPLAERLIRVKNDLPSDPEMTYDKLVQAIYNMPLYDYLDSETLECLASDIAWEGSSREIGEMTYGELIARIHDQWHPFDSAQNFHLGSALVNLLRPYYLEHRRRRRNG